MSAETVHGIVGIMFAVGASVFLYLMWRHLQDIRKERDALLDAADKSKGALEEIKTSLEETASVSENLDSKVEVLRDQASHGGPLGDQVQKIEGAGSLDDFLFLDEGHTYWTDEGSVDLGELDLEDDEVEL